VCGTSPAEATLRVILDQTANLHRLYRLAALRPDGNHGRIAGRSLKALQELVVKGQIVRHAQAACGFLEPLVRAKRINAEDMAHRGKAR